MASRVGLDTQGRLILRENGKIILPYEHFANAVMLKHMNGPHGLHLGLEATVRAVSIKGVCNKNNLNVCLIIRYSCNFNFVTCINRLVVLDWLLNKQVQLF